MKRFSALSITALFMLLAFVATTTAQDALTDEGTPPAPKVKPIKPKNVGEAAAEAFGDAAARRGVTPDELRDRVVPWLGFEPAVPRLVDCGGKTVELRVGHDFALGFRDGHDRER